jgi:hypothetical protein
MNGKFKDKLALTLSSLAFALSLYATFTTERRASDDKRRTVRNQLTDVLARLTSLQLDNAKLMHEAKGDAMYTQSVSMALGQQNGFLLDQAFYLADQIPSLVTTYEFNSIAAASFGAGDVLSAEKYHLKAIEVAHSDLYRAQATRGYAVFLFSQRRFVEGRDQFNKSLTLLKGGSDNLSRETNGITYQTWAWNEQNLALSPQDANNLYDKARTEFNGIDVEFLRGSLLQSLEAVKSMGSMPPPTPGSNRIVPQAGPLGNVRH